MYCDKRTHLRYKSNKKAAGDIGDVFDDDRDIMANSQKSMPWKDMLEQAKSFKAEGNSLFKEKQYKKAAGKYHRGLLFLKGIESKQNALPFPIPTVESPQLSAEELSATSAVRVDIYNNLAACLLQMDPPRYDKVCQYCEHVLEDQPSNPKAMYRNAVALYNLRDVEAALKLLKKLHATNPRDANVKKYLELCEKESARQDADLRNTYKGMFEKK